MLKKISFKSFAKQFDGKIVKYRGIPLNFDMLNPVDVLLKIEEKPEYGILLTRVSNGLMMSYRESESTVEYDNIKDCYILHNFNKKHYFSQHL